MLMGWWDFYGDGDMLDISTVMGTGTEGTAAGILLQGRCYWNTATMMGCCY